MSQPCPGRILHWRYERKSYIWTVSTAHKLPIGEVQRALVISTFLNHVAIAEYFPLNIVQNCRIRHYQSMWSYFIIHKQTRTRESGKIRNQRGRNASAQLVSPKIQILNGGAQQCNLRGKI